MHCQADTINGFQSATVGHADMDDCEYDYDDDVDVDDDYALQSNKFSLAQFAQSRPSPRPKPSPKPGCRRAALLEEPMGVLIRVVRVYMCVCVGVKLSQMK